MLVVVLAAGCGLVIGVVASGGEGPENAPKPASIITVTGGATVETEPDEATIRLGINTEADTAEAALQENATKSDAVMKSLKDNGVAEEDIQTTNVRLDKRYQDRGTPKETVTFVANTELTVLTRDLDKVGTIIGDAVSAGANDVQGVEFGLSSEASAKGRALTEAVKGAKAKAETLAAAAGAELGAVVRIDEDAYDVQPYYERGYAVGDQALMAMPSAAPYKVAPGQVETHVEIRVVFELEAG
jgi:hypothetical protein